jgi:predicted MFS family arabinose efflux permease
MPRHPTWLQIVVRTVHASWRLVAIGLLLCALLLMVEHLYLRPAAEASATAPAEMRKILRTMTQLMVWLIVTVMLVGVVWIGRRRG